jgi:hypothetical protein
VQPDAFFNLLLESLVDEPQVHYRASACSFDQRSMAINRPAPRQAVAHP